jgi:isoquinoline 1-oxidoreductase beta subunit
MRPEWLKNAGSPGAATGAASAGTSRRAFLKAGAAGAGGLVLGFMLPGGGRMARAADAAKPVVHAPNAF